MIDYSKKITTTRAYPFGNDIEIAVESDRGRIISSAAFRRLQKRTQVFALELNASIRSRLTHSLEVAQTARYIARTILKELKEEGINAYSLQGLEHAFVSIAEMSSLLHDIGNPPFGHFGEETINKWVRENVVERFDALLSSSQTTQALQEKLKKDIANYDGNAQAIRIVTKLQRLNLTYTQVLSVLKYTRAAFEDRPVDGNYTYLMKKPGFYYSESQLIETMQESLGVKSGHRFPIAYIMEAADDISYLTADLEDAVEKGILSIDEIYMIIRQLCEEKGEEYLLNVIQTRYDKAKKNPEPYIFDMFFTMIRATLIGDLVKYVTRIYIENHQAIFDGSFNAPLLEYDKESKYYTAIEILQDIAKQYIYQNKEVQQLELQGYSILTALLNHYSILLDLSADDFDRLLQGKRVDCLLSALLVKRLSSKHIVAYRDDLKKIDKENQEEYKLLELYYRTRLIIDYISGMTDDYALHEYKTLQALK